MKVDKLRRRDKLLIIVDILRLLARGKLLKTNIMYKANLSKQQLEEYLSLLIELRLIGKAKKENGGRQYYKITTKGRRLARAFKKIENILGEEGWKRIYPSGR